MEHELNQMKRILYCTDFSDNANRAFDYALTTAALRPHCELHLLHVIPEADAQFWKNYIYEADGDADRKAAKDIDEKINRDYAPRVPKDMIFKTAFRIGKDHAEILKYAEEISADLIIMGRIGTGSIGSLLFGSVAEKVVKRASCPVLVVPQERK